METIEDREFVFTQYMEMKEPVDMVEQSLSSIEWDVLHTTKCITDFLARGRKKVI